VRLALRHLSAQGRMPLLVVLCGGFCRVHRAV
jgi:hypothetical protein